MKNCVVVCVVLCAIVKLSVSAEIIGDEFCEKGDIGEKGSALCSKTLKSRLISEGNLIHC